MKAKVQPARKKKAKLWKLQYYMIKVHILNALKAEDT